MLKSPKMKKTLFIISFLIVQLSFSNVVVLNGLTHVHESESGQVISGVIKLKNTKDTQQRVVVYFNDLFQKCGEKTMLTATLSHERSINKWFSTEVNEYVLQPKEEYELLYTISVPNDNTLSGSFWGVLMVEIEEPIKEDELEYSVKLESKVRYGIQIITDINDKTESELDFYNVKIEKEEGIAKSITLEVENLGVFYVEPTIVLEIFNEEGAQAKKLEVKFKKIYPGNCKVFSLDISDLPKGTFSGVMVADYGENMYAIDIEFEK